MNPYLIILGGACLVYFLYFRNRLPEEVSLSVAQAQKRIQEGKDLQILDVRTRGEYAKGHLKDAHLIPVQELGARLRELDKSKPVLVYCRSGHRSAMALYVLLRADFDAVHMKPGFLGWQSHDLPVEK